MQFCLDGKLCVEVVHRLHAFEVKIALAQVAFRLKTALGHQNGPLSEHDTAQTDAKCEVEIMFYVGTWTDGNQHIASTRSMC